MIPKTFKNHPVLTSTLVYIILYTICSFFLNPFSVTKNGASTSFNYEITFIVFFCCFLAIAFFLKINNRQISNDQKMGFILLNILTTILIDTFNLYLKGLFTSHKIVELFFFYMVTFVVIGGFIFFCGTALSCKFFSKKKNT